MQDQSKQNMGQPKPEMVTTKQGAENSKPWVRLHMARQTDSCRMPDVIIGKLQKETPTEFVLTNVLEITPEGVSERNFYDVINRTYVYRCEVIGFRPDDEEILASQYGEVMGPSLGGGFGGLG